MRAFRWIGIGALTLAAILLIALVGVYIASSLRLNKT